MPSPFLVSTQRSYTTPLLVVDREGTLGEALVKTLQETYLTVFVSAKEPPFHKNLVVVPFKKKIPVIPDNTFSHIFLFFHGEKELAEAMPAFIKKAKESNATLVIILSLFHYSDHLAHKLTQLYERTQILVLGDVFHHDSPPTSPVTTLLFEAKTYGRIELANSGLEAVYPVAQNDVVEAITAISFSSAKEGGIFALYPQYPPTQLSFVRALQQTYPLLQVDFVKNKHHSRPQTLPENPLYVFGAAYPFPARLKALDLTHTPLARYSKDVSPKKQRATQQQPVHKLIFLSLSLVFFLLSLPLLLSVGFSFGGGLLLLSTQKELKQGNLSQSYNSAKAASSLFSVADQSATTLQAAVGLIGLREEVVGFRSTIHAGYEVAQALEEGTDAGVQIQAVLLGKSQQPKKDFLNGTNKLKESLTLIQGLQAEGSLPATYRDKLSQLQVPLGLVLNTVDTYPTLLGFDKPQTYLVLFQNNFELRPTGGFIGSYGLVTFDQGRMTDFTIHDVYDADGRLATHVEPPFPLRRYMGASHWFMRDSNYAVDFPTAAAKVADFLKIETGKQVDGVIGIDMTFLTSLFNATGPLSLPDYHETLTPENAYLTIENHVEKNFFPGSTQKKDFLNAVRRAFDQKWDNRQVSYAALLQAVSQALTQKHLLVAFADQSMQQLYTVNGLSSSLWEDRDASPVTVQDFLGVVEANIGLNKDNYYLKRRISQKVSLDGEGTVTETVTLRYTNESTKTSPFAGEYKAYTRLLVPLDSTLTQVTVDGEVQKIVPAVTDPRVFTAKTFKPPAGMEIETASASGKETFGFLLTVPQQQTKTVTFTYQLAQKAQIDKPSYSYDLKLFKQPGTLNDPYSLSVSYPLGSKILSSSEAVTDLGGKFAYEKQLSQDRDITVTFAKR